MLNGNLCAQWEIIMCSTANYWSAQQEFRCSMGSYVLNWKLLCAQQEVIAQWEIIMCSTGHYWSAQQEVMCSMGNYNVLNCKLLECSTRIQVLNGKLCAQWEIIMCSTGHYWGAQQEVLHGKLMVCIL